MCGDREMKRQAQERPWPCSAETAFTSRGVGVGAAYTHPHWQPEMASTPRSSHLSLPGVTVTGAHHHTQLETDVFKEIKKT